MAALRARTGIAIAGNEINHVGLPEVRVMLEKRSLDVYQPDAVFAGGIAETWRMVQAIAAAGARYTPHTWTNGIGFAINLQLFAASPWRADTLLEYPLSPPGWLPQYRDGLLEKPWLHDRGWLELPTAPGLGFEVDAGQLARHGKRFFHGTGLRVAVRAVLDRGIKTAREVGAVRANRLAQRSAALDKASGAGEDLLAPFCPRVTAAARASWKLEDAATAPAS